MEIKIKLGNPINFNYENQTDLSEEYYLKKCSTDPETNPIEVEIKDIWRDYLPLIIKEGDSVFYVPVEFLQVDEVIETRRYPDNTICFSLTEKVKNRIDIVVSKTVEKIIKRKQPSEWTYRNILEQEDDLEYELDQVRVERREFEKRKVEWEHLMKGFERVKQNIEQSQKG